MPVTERDAVVAALEANLRHVERIVAHADPAKAATRRDPARWSALEVLEHLAVIEKGVQKVIAGAAGTPPSELRTRAKDQIVAGAAEPVSKLVAPEMVAPNGRYATLAEALQAFRERRTITIDLARSLDVAWDAHHAPHPYFGPLDIGQWLLLAATHGERHAKQFAAESA